MSYQRGRIRRPGLAWSAVAAVAAGLALVVAGCSSGSPAPAASNQVAFTPSDHQLVMFSNTPAGDRQAAWQFMTWLSTSDYAVVNYTIPYEGSIPPLAHPTGAVEKQLKNPVSQEFIKAVIPTVNTPHWGAQYSSAYLDVMAAIQQAMTSTTPVSSIASGLQSKLGTDLAGQTGP